MIWGKKKLNMEGNDVEIERGRFGKFHLKMVAYLNHYWVNFAEPLFEEVFPSLDIVEQPESSYRFRYGSEGDVVAPLHGANSSPSKKSFPKIKLNNFDSQRFVKVDIIVSCITHDDETSPRVHPFMVKNNKRVRRLHEREATKK